MLKSLGVMLMAALLGGCAAMNQLSSEVSTYGSWPSDRTNPSYVFDRLPSHSAEQQQVLESAAMPALARAGFRVAGDASSADVIVQLGAAVTADLRWFDDYPIYAPYGWYGSWRYRHFGLGIGGGWGWSRHVGPPATPTYSREVVVLIRDRRSGQTIYETRASNSGYSPAINSLLPAMFDAALADFPNRGANPRRIVTPLPG